MKRIAFLKVRQRDLFLLAFFFVSFLFYLFIPPVFAFEYIQGNHLIADGENNLIWATKPYPPLNQSDAATFASDYIYRGYSNWRLPTKTELLSIVDTTKDPKIDEHFNLGNVANWTCWSSDTFTASRTSLPARAYTVFFGDGLAYNDYVGAYHAFLLVVDSSFSFTYTFPLVLE